MRYLLTVLLLLVITSPTVHGDDKGDIDYFRSISNQPDDSTLAENLRIWLPIERSQRCRMSIEISDSTGQVVRHLLNRLMPMGYYNLYWDRLDDSGATVPAGTYLYSITDCGSLWRTGQLTVTYPRGEQFVEFKVPTRTAPDSIWFYVNTDTIRVTMQLFDGYDILVAEPMTDSLFTAGEYGWAWDPDETNTPTETGRYRLTASFDGFQYKTIIWYKR